MLKSGTLSISANKEKLFQITASNNIIDFNILDKKFVHELTKDTEKLSSFHQLLDSLKNWAGDLRNQETTVTISYKNQKVITIGSDAKPKFSKIITGTADIEINNIKRLIKMGTL
jgi:hypothetical protein